MWLNVIYLLLLKDDIEDLKSSRSNVTAEFYLTGNQPVKTDGMKSELNFSRKKFVLQVYLYD